MNQFLYFELFKTLSVIAQFPPNLTVFEKNAMCKTEKVFQSKSKKTLKLFFNLRFLIFNFEVFVKKFKCFKLLQKLFVWRYFSANIPVFELTAIKTN